MIRHIITSEYPPQAGGVSDYTELVAAELAVAGDEVHVWCPGDKRSESRGQSSDVGGQGSEARERKEATLIVHRDFGRFAPADLRRVGKLLDRFSTPRNLLVQWVPHGYGCRSMNLPFCLWLWQRATLKGDHLELMVHEPFLAFEGSRKQDLAAAAHRLMVTVLQNAASRVWVSIPEWEKHLRPFAPNRRNLFKWLPVPSNISVIDDPDGVTRVRAQFGLPGAPLVGHFGAYNQYMIELMSKLLPELLSGRQLSVLLVGKGSLELREHVIRLHPDLAGKVHATGSLASDSISRHISACDVMLQPYEDGVSGRRTSAMTALLHGVAVVTNFGKATEAVWAESRAVVLTRVGDIEAMVEATQVLLNDEEQRRSMGELALGLYRDRFALHHTVSALRGDVFPVSAEIQQDANALV